MTNEDVLPVFEHVHMDGPRFAHHALPLSAVGELRNYQSLLEKVAKALFLRDNPERKRVASKDLGIAGFDFLVTRVTSLALSRRWVDGSGLR